MISIYIKVSTMIRLTQTNKNKLWKKKKNYTTSGKIETPRELSSQLGLSFWVIGTLEFVFSPASSDFFRWCFSRWFSISWSWSALFSAAVPTIASSIPCRKKSLKLRFESADFDEQMEIRRSDLLVRKQGEAAEDSTAPEPVWTERNWGISEYKK